MKIAILGEQNRATAWEKHLRKLSAITEVVITSSIPEKDSVDAAILLDNTDLKLNSLEQLIKLGIHSYLVSHLPLDEKALEKVHHSAQEADVRVQFSHWPSLAPASLWMKQKIKKPNLIQIKREVKFLSGAIDQTEIDHHWIDEVAWIIKSLGGNVHRIEAKPMVINQVRLGLNVTLRYEDSSVASIQFSALGGTNLHQRIISDENLAIDCDAIHQLVHLYRVNDFGNLKKETKKFDPKSTAEVSVLQFIKSIQLERDTLFNAYDALQTAKIVDKIHNQIRKM
ncbi:hypothetical protein [Rhodohalobacter sp.]|uniref:hypothetical protein n=1 Tax=Rhodohalobacter sp. TaxID=1974210 RepID=UPI002ACD7B14|nr:hypothetical protein [Rhodohalobacter sp.]MDZ7756897.1 hypothetical protein [Rhodohalobacter sp.]